MKKAYSMKDKNIGIVYSYMRDVTPRSLHTAVLYINKNKNTCTYIDSIDGGDYASPIEEMAKEKKYPCKFLSMAMHQQRDEYSCPVFAIRNFSLLPTLNWPDKIGVNLSCPENSKREMDYVQLPLPFMQLTQSIRQVDQFLDQVPLTPNEKKSFIGGQVRTVIPPASQYLQDNVKNSVFGHDESLLSLYYGEKEKPINGTSRVDLNKYIIEFITECMRQVTVERKMQSLKDSKGSN